MNRNVGSADRVARIVLGIAVLVAGSVLGSWWGLVGLVPLATGLIGWCPAYLPFGISTCRLRAEGS
jgi:hypothetical protein